VSRAFLTGEIMNTRSRIFSAVLTGVGVWFVARHFYRVAAANDKLKVKAFDKEAKQTWEDEGGNVVGVPIAK
jgi:type IV secretory pathway TrbD component